MNGGSRGLKGVLRHLSGKIDRRGGVGEEPSDDCAELCKEALVPVSTDRRHHDSACRGGDGLLACVMPRVNSPRGGKAALFEMNLRA